MRASGVLACSERSLTVHSLGFCDPTHKGSPRCLSCVPVLYNGSAAQHVLQAGGICPEVLGDLRPISGRITLHKDSQHAVALRFSLPHGYPSDGAPDLRLELDVPRCALLILDPQPQALLLHPLELLTPPLPPLPARVLSSHPSIFLLPVPFFAPTPCRRTACGWPHPCTHSIPVAARSYCSVHSLVISGQECPCMHLAAVGFPGRDVLSLLLADRSSEHALYTTLSDELSAHVAGQQGEECLLTTIDLLQARSVMRCSHHAQMPPLGTEYAVFLSSEEKHSSSPVAHSAVFFLYHRTEPKLCFAGWSAPAAYPTAALSLAASRQGALTSRTAWRHLHFPSLRQYRSVDGLYGVCISQP